MYFLFRRIWIFLAFFISLGIGSFFGSSLGMSDDLGYTLGCILGVVIWAIGVTLLSRTMGPEKEEHKYIETLKKATQFQEDINQNSQIASSSTTVNTNMSEMKKCPFCAEFIKAEAVVCRYCGRDLPAINPLTSTLGSKNNNQSNQSSPVLRPDPERIRELLNELDRQEAYRRKEAVQELGNIEFPPQNRQESRVIRSIENLASSDPNTDVRTAAALALLSLRAKHN